MARVHPESWTLRNSTDFFLEGIHLRFPYSFVSRVVACGNSFGTDYAHVLLEEKRE
jgi:hypothetical protein